MKFKTLISIFILILMVFPSHSLISQDKKSNLNWLNEYYPQINLNTNNPPTDLTQYENDGLEFRRGKGHTFSQVI